MSDPQREFVLHQTRRQLFGKMTSGIGTAALGTLLGATKPTAHPALPGLPHFAAKAKRIIYLHQSGAPSQLDLFDPKPKMAARFGGAGG